MLHLIDSNAIKNRTSLRRTLRSLTLVILFLSATLSYAANEQPKAVWYRYYDSNGVANVSTSVTPAHIRYGYESLDRNMQVIKRNHAYNAEQDQKQSSNRAAQAKRQDNDLRLKRAYGSSKIAVIKRDDQLKNIQKQLSLQQQQLRQLQSDRIAYKRQEAEYYRKGKPVPAVLNDRLNYNEQNINTTKKSIESLQTTYRNTQINYEDIINRLKAME